MLNTQRLILSLTAAVALASLCGCSRAGGASDSHRELTPRNADKTSAAPAAPLNAASRLEQLRLSGRFDEFATEALGAANDNPHDAAVGLQATEALLALGRPAEAARAAAHAAELSLAASQPLLGAQALRLWAIARFRQGQSLADATIDKHIAALGSEEPTVDLLQFWRDELGDRTPYRLDAVDSETFELTMADASPGSLAFELAAIEVTTNGTRQPLAFIDSGAQYTVMTTAAAQAAGVRLGKADTQLTGFVGFAAQPAVIETLELGGLTLYDVPVLVGDSPPLVAAGGQMSLGIDLMHHVRFTIDYPARRVSAAKADAPLSAADQPPLWEIPLWTFSQMCLAQGASLEDDHVRVLVDTGDRAGSYLSYRWGRRNLPQLAGPNSAMVFRYKKRNMTLDVLQLGSQTLADWPILDTIPAELDRLNLVDVIAGHDLLWPYQLTLDVSGRRLLLQAGPTSAQRGAGHVTGVNDEQ